MAIMNTSKTDYKRTQIKLFQKYPVEILFTSAKH